MNTLAAVGAITIGGLAVFGLFVVVVNVLKGMDR